MAIESVELIGIERVIHEADSLSVDTLAEFHLPESINGDINRSVYFSGSDSVSMDTQRVVRTKPNYRMIHNTGQPFTYPDGRAIDNTKITFTLCDASGHAIQGSDPATGDTVIGTVTAYTDEYGEFIAHLWPNSRASMETYYMFHIDFYGMDDGMIYIPEHGDPLLFSTAWKYHDGVPDPRFESKDSRDLPFIIDLISM